MSKPHIAPYLTTSGLLKWRCVTICQSILGNNFERMGTGYTPREAYDRWKRAASGTITLWNPCLRRLGR